MATGATLGAEGRQPRLVSDRSIVALAALNFFLADARDGLAPRSIDIVLLCGFFLADARDGLGPFLDAFLATQGWSTLTLGLIATVGGLLGLAATPLAGALVDGSTWKRALIAGPVVLVTAAALLTLTSPDPVVVWAGQIGTAVVGAVVGPALAGLTLGLVGERLFARQIARNEFWNHGGNFASLFAVYVIVSMFGQFGIVWLMMATAAGALIAVLAIDPARIDHRVARGLGRDDGAPGPSGFGILLAKPGLILLAVVLLIFHWGNAPMSRLIAQEFSIELGTPFRTTAIVTGVAQLTMIFVAALTPFLIRRLGLANVFLIALLALPLRGLLAGEPGRVLGGLSGADAGRDRRRADGDRDPGRGGTPALGNRPLQRRPRGRDDNARRRRKASAPR